MRLKLTLAYAALFAATVVLGALGVYFTARGALTGTLDASLREQARAARGSVVARPALAEFGAALVPPRDVYLELLDASGHLLDTAGRREEAPHALPLSLGTLSAEERRVLTVALPTGLLLRVSRRDDTVREVLETLAKVLLGATVAMIAAACAVGYLLADRALRPVDAVARLAERVAARGGEGERVPVPPGKDEMARLTRTVNAMLDRLETTIERERRFARTAAHELRTPLTALRGRLDLALDRPRDAREYQDALEAMRGRVDHLSALAEQLLALARAETVRLLIPVELGAVALEAADLLADAARAGGVQLDLDVEECWVRADELEARQVIVNLLDNALKYGGKRVRLSVNAAGLTVLDGGRGPPQDEWARLLRPFERGAAPPGAPGSGLGLALAEALAARWGAALRPEWSPGGFAVHLRWTEPRADGEAPQAPPGKRTAFSRVTTQES